MQPLDQQARLRHGITAVAHPARPVDRGLLGLGPQPPVPEWGLLIAEGRNYLSTAWWLTTFPGIAVIAVVLAANRISQQLNRERR